MIILITCPPMLNTKDQYLPYLNSKGINAYCPDVVQTLSEKELLDIVPGYDGWIIGDDPATRCVFEAGKRGRLKAAVKWGIGVDNVDFKACRDLGIPITNTPNMFGREVADIAIGYVIGLARGTYLIDREIRDGNWPKYRGISLAEKHVGLVGYGDIGKNTAKRLIAADMEVVCYDPAYAPGKLDDGVQILEWPDRLNKCDFIVLTCSLTPDNRHMLNRDSLSWCKQGVRVVNVSRGALIDELALIDAMRSGQVASAAMDVFEVEPLSMNSTLREIPHCIFGSHNASNTNEAVSKTNDRAISEMLRFLDIDA
jgi:phosphoglycerate dehydrogenase-like enzyme